VLAGGEQRGVPDPRAELRRGPGWVRASWPDGITLRVAARPSRHGGVTLRSELVAGASLRLDALGVRLRGARASRVLVDGYHSWDWTGVRDATAPGRGWWSAVWGDEGADSLLTVALAAPPRTGALWLRWQGPDGLDALCAGEPVQHGQRTGPPLSLDLPVAASTTLRSDPLRVAALDRRRGAGTGLPGELGAVTTARLVGWMSWNSLGASVTAADVVAAAGQLCPPGGLALLDDGWMRCWGDWQVHDGFGSNLTELAAAVRRQGRHLGVWAAPFLVDARMGTQLAALLLRDAEGAPVVDVRASADRLVLDASRPEVRHHLAALGAAFARCGVRALKLDFLYAGALPGARAAGWSGVRALREGMAALVGAYRAAAAPGSAVLACGAPAPPIVGLADTCRSGGDAVVNVPGTHAAPPPRPWFTHGELVVRAQARNLAARAWLWGTTLPPDIDAVTLGQIADTPPPGGELAAQWLRLAERSGGPLLDSDRPAAALDPARLRQLRATWHRVAGRPPRPDRSHDPLAMPPAPMSEDDFYSWTEPPGWEPSE